MKGYKIIISIILVILVLIGFGYCSKLIYDQKLEISNINHIISNQDNKLKEQLTEINLLQESISNKDNAIRALQLSKESEVDNCNKTLKNLIELNNIVETNKEEEGVNKDEEFINLRNNIYQRYITK